MKVAPYIHFDGQCREAFEFYAATLGGRMNMLMTYADAPVPTHVSEAEKGRVMHCSLSVGDDIIMGSDAPPGMFEGKMGFSISLHPAEPAEAEQIYAALAENGTVRMPIQETFWAHRFAMLTDRFGTSWMVSCDKTPGAA